MEFVLLNQNNMPLGKSVSKNMHELSADNKKSGQAKGAKGKVRSRKQMIAIALSAAGKSKHENMELLLKR